MGRPTQVAIVSHDGALARAFQQRLAQAIAGIEGADLQALAWVTGEQALAARDASVCLLLAWDSEEGAAGASLEALLAHQQLRQSLQASGQSFAVLRGSPQQQVQQALAALSRLQTALKPDGAQTLPRPGWLSACERCDEPECEHRLLTGLLKPD